MSISSTIYSSNCLLDFNWLKKILKKNKCDNDVNEYSLIIHLIKLNYQRFGKNKSISHSDLYHHIDSLSLSIKELIKKKILINIINNHSLQVSNVVENSDDDVSKEDEEAGEEAGEGEEGGEEGEGEKVKEIDDRRIGDLNLLTSEELQERVSKTINAYYVSKLDIDNIDEVQDKLKYGRMIHQFIKENKYYYTPSYGYVPAFGQKDNLENLLKSLSLEISYCDLFKLYKEYINPNRDRNDQSSQIEKGSSTQTKSRTLENNRIIHSNQYIKPYLVCYITRELSKYGFGYTYFDNYKLLSKLFETLTYPIFTFEGSNDINVKPETKNKEIIEIKANNKIINVINSNIEVSGKTKIIEVSWNNGDHRKDKPLLISMTTDDILNFSSNDQFFHTICLTNKTWSKNYYFLSMTSPQNNISLKHKFKEPGHYYVYDTMNPSLICLIIDVSGDSNPKVSTVKSEIKSVKPVKVEVKSNKKVNNIFGNMNLIYQLFSRELINDLYRMYKLDLAFKRLYVIILKHRDNFDQYETIITNGTEELADNLLKIGSSKDLPQFVKSLNKDDSVHNIMKQLILDNNL